MAAHEKSVTGANATALVQLKQLSCTGLVCPSPSGRPPLAGVAAQKSVFIVKGTEADLETLMDQIADMMDLDEDDLRAYPIHHPAQLWTNGPNPLTDMPLVHFGGTDRKTVRTRRRPAKSGLLKRLFGIQKAEDERKRK